MIFHLPILGFVKAEQSFHGLVRSPFYITPKVLAGAYTQVSNVWSSGVILYIILSRNTPFWGKTKSLTF